MKDIELWLGDCLELMDDIPDSSVDLILADLPYGTTKCKWDIIIPFVPLWKQYKRIIKDGAGIVLFGGEPFSSLLRTSNLEWYKYDWTWDKVTARGHLVAKKRPMQQSECISVFGKEKILYNPQMINRPLDKIRKTREYKRTEIMGGLQTSSTDRVYDKWYPKTILSYSNAGSSVKSFHPTQKPVELLEYLILTYSNENDLVLDNTMGVGSTIFACKNTNRRGIGIEKEKKYYDIAVERILGLDK